jgi:superfamily II DNA or RNA helicase
MTEDEVIKKTILSQLELDACCRIHIHRECCLKLGLTTEPRYSAKGKRTYICKDLPDKKFDDRFNELIRKGMIRKIRAKTIELQNRKIELDKIETIEQIGSYTFYELTPKGRTFLKILMGNLS